MYKLGSVKKSLINFLRGIMVVVMLLKLAFILEIPQKDSFQIFALEMNEVESEESQKSATDGDEFIELSFNWEHSNQPLSSACMTFFIRNIEAHIREIVPPPPQA
jgi:hypothetical protein